MCPGARFASATCIRLFLVHDQLRADGLCWHWLLRAGCGTSILLSVPGHTHLAKAHQVPAFQARRGRLRLRGSYSEHLLPRSPQSGRKHPRYTNKIITAVYAGAMLREHGRFCKTCLQTQVAEAASSDGPRGFLPFVLQVLKFSFRVVHVCTGSQTTG